MPVPVGTSASGPIYGSRLVAYAHAVDRNIVTESDVIRRAIRQPTIRGAESPNTQQLTADDYWSRLTKYVPIEIISAYLILKGLIESDTGSSQSVQNIFLATIVVLGIAGTWAFAQVALKVVRPAQITISCIAFIAWSAVSGGWFSLQGWYRPWFGAALVVVFGVLVRIVKVPPLPPDEDLK
jgi:hypothetical protein